MEQNLKDQIVQGARQYMNEKRLSQAALARYCDISPSYLSNMLNGMYDYKAAGDKTIKIADRYFEAIARAIDMSLIVAYWKTVETPQFIELISALEDAKERGVAKMILGETGCGKTFTTNKFIGANPANTFRITVSNQHKIQEVTEELGRALDIRLGINHRKAYRMRAITDCLRDISEQGGKPLVIIDEAENLTHAMIGLCKGIYDAINEYSGLVLIGTDELESKLEKMARYHFTYPGIPQFRRRFKAGTVRLSKINRRDYDAFFEFVEDLELRKLLKGICDNYGELHDFLEPAIRSAKVHNVPLTDQYFRTIYKIKPNY